MPMSKIVEQDVHSTVEVLTWYVRPFPLDLNGRTKCCAAGALM